MKNKFLAILLASFFCPLNAFAKEEPQKTQDNIIATPSSTPSDQINNLEEKKKQFEDQLNSPTPSTVPTSVPTPVMSVSPEPTINPSVIPTPIPTATPIIKPTPKPIKKPVKPTPIKIKETKEYFLHPGKFVIKSYDVQPHDDMKKIAKVNNLKYKDLMKLNGLTSPYLKIGQKIIIDRHVEPTTNFEGLIVNIPETKLYYFQKGKLLLNFGVAVGQPGRWQTPLGSYKIEEKVKDPVWQVPLSIQNEMKQNGQAVITEIPAGPNNPLGRWFMSLGGGIGIHSTTSPWSIGSAASHGCLRMKSENAEVLFKAVKKNLPVKIIYQPVKISIDEYNNIRLEVYNNVYGKNLDFNKLTRTILKDYDLDKKVNWDLVAKVIKLKNGTTAIIGKKPEPVVAKVVKTELNINKITPKKITPSVKPEEVEKKSE